MDLLSLTKSLKTQAAIDKNESTALGFFVSANGQVESGDFKGQDRLYVKYDFTYGQHWDVVHGVDKGISQIASKSEGSQGTLVWNFPIDILFKSLNAHGWPRLVLSVFGIDGLGRDIAMGYGSLHIPTRAGSYERKVRLFRPVCSSYVQQLVAWVRGTQPEFFDSRFVSKSQGREVTRVESVGTVTVRINVLSRGMRAQGYEDGTKLPRRLVASVDPDAQNKNGNLNGGDGNTAQPMLQSAVTAVLGGGGRNPLQARGVH